MPWLLERMLALSERKATFDSRAMLLRQIASECLNSISMGGVPRSCAERALEQIAWRMQWGRRSILGGGPLYEILAAVRDNREFRLGDLKDNLVRSGILATAGEDGIRFRYESLQAYYAARYLAAAPDRQDLLEDITASLGRMPRARWWENTLVTMAGLLGQSSEGLLQAIVAGSPLVEGDQVYLASRCFLDTRGRHERDGRGRPGSAYYRPDCRRPDLALPSGKSSSVRRSQARGHRPRRVAPSQCHPAPGELGLRGARDGLGNREALRALQHPVDRGERAHADAGRGETVRAREAARP